MFLSLKLFFSQIIRFLDFVQHLMLKKTAFQKPDVYILRWKSVEACAD
jgi:hypothetical protein